MSRSHPTWSNSFHSQLHSVLRWPTTTWRTAGLIGLLPKIPLAVCEPNAIVETSSMVKPGEMLEARTVRLVSHEFVIDDDMDSNTATESNLSPRSRSIFEQGEWSIATDVRPFSRRFNARHGQTFYDLEKVYVFNIGSICIHEKELLRQFTFRQKYRERSHFEADVRHVWKVDIGTTRWDFLSVSNQLGRFSMETVISGQWWRRHQCLALCYVLEKWFRTQHRILFGNSSCIGSKIHDNKEQWTQLRENRWNSGGIFPRIHNIAARPKVHEQNVRTQHNSKDELSACRCSMTSYGILQKMNGNALLTPHLCLCLQKDFQPDAGHSSDLDQKRSGILLSTKDRKENGTELLNWWWSNSEKADTQSSEPRVHCLEERSKAKEVDNYRYTSVPMEIRWKLFFAQSFLSISWVSAEQSQNCVNSAVSVKQAQGDLLWQRNPTHCSTQQNHW